MASAAPQIAVDEGNKVFADGSIYLGQILRKNDQVIANGKGLCVFKTQNRYSGQWVNDKFEGSGKYEWVSGNSYEGTWKGGKRDGVGIFTNGGLKYRQWYKDGKLIKQERYIPDAYSKFLQYVSAVSGADKVFRTIVYISKLLIFALNKYGNTELSKRLGNLASPLSETRVILRFFGLFQTIPGLFSRDPDPFLNISYLIETISMLFYFPLEALGWASSRKIIDGLDAGKLVLWSIRSWLIYIVVDMVLDLNRLLKLKFKRPSLYPDPTDQQPDKLPEEHVSDIDLQRKQVLLKLVQYGADGVLATNWSFEQPPLPDIVMAVSGSISSLVGAYLRWKMT